MDARTPVDPTAKLSPFAPFSHSTYALLWTAMLLSNIGTWMHDVSAAWLMTSLSPSPFVVSLVQAATTGAMALFALPAGAMADLFDRRKLLIALKAISGALAGLLALLTVTGAVDAVSLLLITFLMGICAALAAPVWQSIVPSLVPRDVLQQAVAMNAMGINVARAIGPAIGGAIIVGLGAWAAFAINGVSELIIIAALLIWKPVIASGPPKSLEAFVPAMIAGLRYAAASDLLKPVLIRAAAFFLFASAFWALLPLVARNQLQGGAELYGLMVSAVGAGAVAGALGLPWIKRRIGDANRMITTGSIGMAAVLSVFALLPLQPVALAACLAAGVAWILVLSSLNVAAQNALPDWVRGRGLSIFGLVFFGSMTIGSLVWGTVASGFGLTVGLLAAAAGALIALLAVARVSIADTKHDLMPSAHWPEPFVAAPIDNDRGPVLVTIEYRIAAEKRAEFLTAVAKLEAERRRDGAYRWSVYEDVAEPGRFIETFEEGSWAEHMRHHGRVTKSDADLQATVAAFHTGPEPPRVSHLIGNR